MTWFPAEGAKFFAEFFLNNTSAKLCGKLSALCEKPRPVETHSILRIPNRLPSLSSNNPMKP